MSETKKYPIFKAFSESFLNLTDNFMLFIKIGGIASLILTVLSFVFGQSFICLNLSLKENFYCENNIFIFFTYILLKLFCCSSFLKIWYDRLYLKHQIDYVYFKNNIKDFFRFFGIFISFILINSVPALSLVLLFNRVPNPNWLIEELYFTFVASGFLIPFIFLRFYTNLAECIEKEPWHNFKQIYALTNFNVSRILIAFSFVLGFCFFIFLTVNNNLRLHIFEPYFAYNIFAEFIFEFCILFISGIIINFIRIQKEIFIKS